MPIVIAKHNEKWIASSGFSLATLKNGKININAENNNEYALAAA